MAVLESVPQNEVQEVQHRPMHKVAEAIMHLVHFMPENAPEAMSQHFGHAQKRNDPTPKVDVKHYR